MAFRFIVATIAGVLLSTTVYAQNTPAQFASAKYACKGTLRAIGCSISALVLNKASTESPPIRLILMLSRANTSTDSIKGVVAAKSQYFALSYAGSAMVSGAGRTATPSGKIYAHALIVDEYNRIGAHVVFPQMFKLKFKKSKKASQTVEFSGTLNFAGVEK